MTPAFGYAPPRDEAEKIERRLARYSEAVALVDAGEARPEVVEAVALIRQGFTGVQAAEVLGIASATFYQRLTDPTDEKNRARKARSNGICVDCGGATNNGGGVLPPKRCRTCSIKHQTKWTRENIIAAIRVWAEEHGSPPTSVQWNTGITPRNGDYSYPGTPTIQNMFGSWAEGIRAAGFKPARQTPTGHGPGTADLAETLRLFEAGWTRQRLAERYGITPQAVTHRLRRARGEPMAAPLTAIEIIQRELEKNQARREHLQQEIDALAAEHTNLLKAKTVLNGKAA